MQNSEKSVTKIFADAGIRVNGKNPWDIQVHNPKFFKRVLAGGSLALGESYMDGWWDCKSIDGVFYRILSSKIRQKINPGLVFLAIKSRLMNLQSPARAFQVGEGHYDIGNDLYSKMLDKRMIYSCAYWKDAKNLDEAQEKKLELTCKKLHLKPGMKVLDIGCGWGGFAKYASERYRVKVTGITVSKEQAKIATKICDKNKVRIKVMDYRGLNEKFDRIVSIGMFEHVGPKNYKTYFRKVDQCLNDGGLFLLHTMGKNFSKTYVDPWINKYIFPNGVLPSLKQVFSYSEKFFVLEDIHNFGPYYYRTLAEWEKNFRRGWPKLRKNYSERFYRMWRYYLLICAGAFRARYIQLWQFVFSKGNLKEIYDSIR
ncbi:cyclopropane fatty acyl phospholipid synthase [Candidatus Pacearchaeota archaeon]|nr:cyclopropane fatty acyl phospholipid synthase [Candidatus Pacearchaeota archaeon]